MIVLRDSKIALGGPGDVAKVLQDLLRVEDEVDRHKEHFYAVHLNVRRKITLIEVVSIGTLDASLVHPRETFRRAIQEGSAALIIGHNHPSGETSPSDDDLRLTQRLTAAGTLLGISVVDHVIFSLDSYMSLASQNLI